MVTVRPHSRRILRRDPTLPLVGLLAVLAVGCGEDAPVLTSVGVGLTLRLSDPPGQTCGLGVRLAAPTLIGEPPPSATSRGEPAAAGQNDLDVACTIRQASEGQFTVYIRLSDSARGLYVTVDGSVPAGATGSAKVNVNSVSQGRNMYQEGCTLSAVAPFTVEPGEFWGRFTCPNATTAAATDINCVVDGIVALTGCQD